MPSSQRQKQISDKAYFAAGCFWHVEETFRCLQGVTDTRVGYMGGNLEAPSYEQVCRGDTGHAETVEVTYNPEQISYKDLLDTFFKLHNPTTLNRQGPDIGHQYRSAIFYTNEEQKKEAEAKLDELKKNKAFASPIVTELEAADKFWAAEEYHQKYLSKHNMRACVI